MPNLPMRPLTYLNQPKPARVETKRGVPTCVNGKKVTQLLDRFRTDDTWWRNEQSRMYFELLMEDHNTVTVFQDLRSKEWFSQRYGGMVGK